MAGKEVVLDGELTLLNQLDGEAGSVINVGHGTGITDVQINGTSIVADRVANIPIASETVVGVVKIDLNHGIGISPSTGKIGIDVANSSSIKNGSSTSKSLVPWHQHTAVFYGLAKAAGHDENNSNLPVGQYTEEAKSAIRTMLGLQDVYDDYSSALTALGVI